ncbi:MAG: hypothetical protein Q8L48_18860 [Archangium sp.]|nr:hypothetical protein [Archangium sp.]
MRLSFLTLLFFACGDPTILDGKAYSRACAVSADCVGVFLGNQCEACGCPNAAIASSDKVTYEADRSSALAACGPRPEIGCTPCPDRLPACLLTGSPISEDRACALQ